MAIPAFAASSAGSLGTNFPMGSNASFQRAVYKQLTKENPEFRGQEKNMGFGYLRAEAALSNAIGAYSFNLRKTGNEIATERKLDTNDIFVCTHLAVGIASVDAARPGLAVVQYFPSFVFASTQQPELEILYNGWLTIKVNQVTTFEAIPMDIFRSVPVTQQTAATNRSQGHVVSAAAFLGQFPVFRGNQSIDVTITAPVAGTMAWAHLSTPTTDNKIIFKPYGYLIKGGAAAVTKSDQGNA